jgi:hypothetical protein
METVGHSLTLEAARPPSITLPRESASSMETVGQALFYLAYTVGCFENIFVDDVG